MRRQGRHARVPQYIIKKGKTMRFIPTRFQGTLHYVVGLLLLASPWLMGFIEIEAATWAAVIAGAVVLMQAVVTDFEVGIIQKVPMGVHLMMDLVLGTALAASPWLLSFDGRIYLPHLILGLYLLLASLTTHRSRSRPYPRGHVRPGHVR